VRGARGGEERWKGSAWSGGGCRPRCTRAPPSSIARFRPHASHRSPSQWRRRSRRCRPANMPSRSLASPPTGAPSAALMARAHAHARAADSVSSLTFGTATLRVRRSAAGARAAGGRLVRWRRHCASRHPLARPVRFAAVDASAQIAGASGAALGAARAAVSGCGKSRGSFCSSNSLGRPRTPPFRARAAAPLRSLTPAWGGPTRDASPAALSCAVCAGRARVRVRAPPPQQILPFPAAPPARPRRDGGEQERSVRQKAAHHRRHQTPKWPRAAARAP